MSQKRVVVTGMGIVSCFGNDVDFFYDQLLQGKSGVKTISQFPFDFPTQFAAFVPEFDTGEYIDKKQARRIDPFIRYALVAGKKALESAGLTLESIKQYDVSRCGVIIGSGMGGMETFYEGSITVSQKGYKRLSPFFVPYIITNMGGALLAIDYGFTGPNYSISTACATANYSIAAAANHIRRNEADIMVCGGSEGCATPIGIAGFVANGALSERNDDPQGASRPWDQSRDGFVIGEGAGVLVLESLEHALARKAPILAEYLGGGISCDAYHITALKEDGSGIGLCLHHAFKDAGIKPSDIDYINAHATSTPRGDLVEVKAILDILGSHAKNIVMNATKSMTGHCLGAAGGIEAIATIKALQTGYIHPTINVTNPDPLLKDINIVLGKAQKKDIKVALSNSFGFGGHNSAIILSKYSD